MKKIFEQVFLILTIVALTLFIKVSEIPVWFTEHSNILCMVYIFSWFIYCLLDNNDKR